MGSMERGNYIRNKLRGKERVRELMKKKVDGDKGEEEIYIYMK